MAFLLRCPQRLLWQIKCLSCLWISTIVDIESCSRHTFLSLYESPLLKFICLPVFYSHYLSVISTDLSVYFEISFSLSTGTIQNIFNPKIPGPSGQDALTFPFVNTMFLKPDYLLLLMAWKWLYTAFVFQTLAVSYPIPIFSATACLNDIQNAVLLRSCVPHFCDPDTSISWANEHWIYECKGMSEYHLSNRRKRIIYEATKMLLLTRSIYTNQPFHKIFAVI